jgi:hypothetical protein
VRVPKTPAAAIRLLVAETPKAASDKSYKNKEPRWLKAGLSTEIESARAAYFFGAEESPLLLVLLLDFFADFLWPLFFLLLWVVDFAGADDDVSDAGDVVSAASTGPAASVNRQTTGTSFLNIDRLHCKEKI